MTIQIDGQAKCDKCGKLDGDTKSNKLQDGWVRDISARKHYCPECKGVKT